MAAEAQRATSSRERMSIAAKLRRFFAPIEPWYDWGATHVERLDAPGEGPGRFVELQWLGLSITVFFGRTPKRVQP
jgi:hypothetical protein